MNRILKEDIESFSLPCDLKEMLQGSVIMVTGATGLVGSSLVRCLHALNIGVRFILPVRNVGKASEMFRDMPDSCISIIGLSQGSFSPDGIRCDYIVHCASPTNGAYMAGHPVETFTTSVEYTRQLLEYCRMNPVRGMVYLSSIEYYGQIFNDDPVSEDMMGYVDHCSPRNSYVLGKQAAEYLVFAYADEYGVAAKTARLTQTFGAGISSDDKRVFAQFAASVVAGEKIVLHTPGKSAKPYCYLTDCVAAILYILLKGKNGESYNVAAPSTYVSIFELAELFSSFLDIEEPLCFDFSSEHNYAPETRINMDCKKLLDLGWRPRYQLKEMVERLIDYIRLQNK